MINLRKYRKAAGLTQVELGAKVGVKQPAVAAWEKGVATPSIKKLALIAVALNCTVDDIIRT